MKKKVFISFLIMTLILVYGTGEVKIVRTVPKSAQNTVEATWSKPTPKPTATTLGSKTQFSGRLSVGGSGGIDTGGKQLYDWFSDSHLLLVQPLGSMGNLSFRGKAFRKNIIGGMNQNYLAKFILSMNKLRFLSAITYTEKQNIVDQLKKDDMNTLIEASLNINYIESLPISLFYSHKMVQKKEGSEEPTTVTDDNFADSASLRILGSLGGFNLTLLSSFNNQVNTAKSMNNTGFAGTLSVVSPLLAFVKVEASLSPRISSVRYTETQNEISNTTLDSGIGLIFPLTETLTFTTRGGRVDSWITKSGSDAGEYTPYISGWKASTNLEYKSDFGLSAKTEYKLNSTDVSFNHQASIFAGLKGKATPIGPTSKTGGSTTTTEKTVSIDWLENLTARGALNQQYDTSQSGSPWKLNNNKLSWGTDIAISPIKKMSISGRYTGNMTGIAEYDWINVLSTSFKHQPDPMLLYGLGAGLKSISYSSGTNSLTQNYSANLTLSPRWNLKVYTFGIGEGLFLTNSINKNSENALQISSRQTLSKLSYDMGIPILTFLQTRYHFTWEWLNGQTAEVPPTTVSENNFQHIFGITLSGKPIPFTLTATYALSHGTRGIRHDVNSTLNFPLGKSFSLEGRFSLSYYTENGAEKMPFLGGLNMAYEF